MSGLARLQASLLQHLREPRDIGVPGVPGVADGRLPASTGLRIYSHAYRARLGEALGNDHRQLGRYLGDTLWAEMLAGYVQRHPSTVRSLRDFGAALPSYLACTPPFSADARIAELARFERALLDTFDAADAPRVDFEALRARDPWQWPGLGLALHPGLGVLLLHTNAVDAWSALQAETAPPTTAASDAAAWAIWRDADRVTRFRSLDAAENAALASIRTASTIAVMCDALGAHRPAAEVPAAALGYLQAWFADGWVASVSGD